MVYFPPFPVYNYTREEDDQMDSIYQKNLTRATEAIRRCHGPKGVHTRSHGDKGIKVWLPWRQHPHMFARYLMTLEGHDQPKMLLDRIDNLGDYHPDNIRFVTYSESRNNSRRDTPIAVSSVPLVVETPPKDVLQAVHKNSLKAFVDVVGCRCQACQGKVVPVWTPLYARCKDCLNVGRRELRALRRLHPTPEAPKPSIKRCPWCRMPKPDDDMIRHPGCHKEYLASKVQP